MWYILILICVFLVPSFGLWLLFRNAEKWDYKDNLGDMGQNFGISRCGNKRFGEEVFRDKEKPLPPIH